MGGGYGCNNLDLEGHYLFAIRLEDGSVHYAEKVENDSKATIPYNALVAMPRLFTRTRRIWPIATTMSPASTSVTCKVGFGSW